MRWTSLFLLFILGFFFTSGIEPGPAVKATTGSVWPKPKYQTITSDYMVIFPSTFKFQVTDQDCRTLQDALKRYAKLMRRSALGLETTEVHRHNESERMKRALSLPWDHDPHFKAILTSLQVQLTLPCGPIKLYPSLHMEEQYELVVNCSNRKAILKGASLWGILRGLETFSQSAVFIGHKSLMINATNILDSPRFPHRGLLLDTSRHYLKVKTILDTLQAMEYNKMNVLHWHIVDDQSFPYQSNTFPSLSQRGAYHPQLVYTKYNIQYIIEYARLRGIRVVPEFDSPGHTRSWGEGQPNLLTRCYNNGTLTSEYGPIDPTLEHNYSFLTKLFGEVKRDFPEQYVHLGGDEVDFTCWASNPNISRFMEKHKLGKDYAKLETYYIQKLVNIVQGLSVSSIVWQEVFTNNVSLDKNTVVHHWTGNSSELLALITKAGYRALLSCGWYLDRYLKLSWKEMYANDPHCFNGSEKQKELMIGGEACLWGEMIDDSNLMSSMWPRASAVAEKLWSSYNATDWNNTDTNLVSSRLEEHTCRMKKRGINAEPANGPGVCL